MISCLTFPWLGAGRGISESLKQEGLIKDSSEARAGEVPEPLQHAVLGMCG